jgi:hypothetical protein
MRDLVSGNNIDHFPMVLGGESDESRITMRMIRINVGRAVECGTIQLEKNVSNGHIFNFMVSFGDDVNGHDIKVNTVKKMTMVANILSINPLFDEMLR